MVKKFKHKKLKNTGLLYEFLIRKMTSDVLNGGQPASVNLIKKYFIKESPLKEELRLYNTLVNTKEKDTNFALKIIESCAESKKNIDTSLLDKQKYNLVKEINSMFDTDHFLRTPIDEYKLYASIYNILEYKQEDNPNLYMRNKLFVANHIVTDSSTKQESRSILENVEPELKNLTFKLLIEKFNDKYKGLTKNQKDILKHLIYNPIDDKITKDFITEQVDELDIKLGLHINKIEDQVNKIKIQEVRKMLPEIKNAAFITESHYLALIRYNELIKELESNV